MRRDSIAGLIMGLALFVMGCSTYEAPKLATTETALLKSTNGCRITHIDGQPIGEFAFVAGGLGGNEVRVVPGTHVIEMYIPNHWGNWECMCRFVCQKGHTYIIRPTSVVNARPTIFDQTLGRNVEDIWLQKLEALYAATATTQPTTAEAAKLGDLVEPANRAPAPTAAAVSQGAVAPTESPAQELDAKPETRITRFELRNKVENGVPGVRLSADVLLRNVPDVEFSLQGIVTDANGVPLQFEGKQLTGCTRVRTGDDEDEDDYSAFIPCQPLYTMKDMPSKVYIQARLIDGTGKIRSATVLRAFSLGGR